MISCFSKTHLQRHPSVSHRSDWTTGRPRRPPLLLLLLVVDPPPPLKSDPDSSRHSAPRSPHHPSRYWSSMRSWRRRRAPAVQVSVFGRRRCACVELIVAMVTGNRARPEDQEVALRGPTCMEIFLFVVLTGCSDWVIRVVV